MKRGRLAREDLSREDLVRLAELAINRDVQTVEELAQVPFPRHDLEKVGAERDGVREVDLLVFSSNSNSEEGEGEEEEGIGKMRMMG